MKTSTHCVARIRTLAAFLLAALSASFMSNALAAQADISNTPMSSVRSALVKPNIMLLMDTSGSMGWTHMPDELETTIGTDSVGYKSPQCNALYYNPKTVYRTPKKPDGSLFAIPSFTGAPYAGYVAYFAAPDAIDSSSVNLSSAFQAYAGKTLRNTAAAGDTAQAAYYYVHSSGLMLGYAHPACADSDTGADRAASGGGTWFRRLVTSTSGIATVTGVDERANFASWYSFYRTRISLTKSAASLAFTPLTDTYRVGFITVRPNNLPASATFDQNKYVAINDFNSTQRTSWFNKLFAQIPGGSSPAREGLARVGRHYGGKQDGINTGMTGDPVQYSCQQNFTIMTTDGYWNTQGETPGGGPVQLDGTTLVGNQDNDLANPLTPRPMYEGDPDGTGRVEDNRNTYSYSACGSFYYLSTQQFLTSSVQNRQSTNQITQTTTQTTVNTAQRLQSTNQILRNSSQVTTSTTQNRSNTNQALQTTRQNLRSTSQNIQTTTQPTRTITVLNIATTQALRSTNQITSRTAQTQQSTTQTLRSTTQNLATSTQNLRSQTQRLQSTLQTLRSTSQATRATTQTTTTSTQVSKSTSQTTSCDASTELCSFTPTCTPSAFVTCSTQNTGPTLVASCTAESPNSGNGYKRTTCSTNTVGPNGTASCSPQTANSGNSFTTITCNTSSTSPTLVSSCTPASANSGNSWTATTCSFNNTGPTAVQTCSASGANSGNSFTSTTCTPNNTGPVGVSSCSDQAASSGNSWTATTCSNNNSSNVPVASCSGSGPNAGNGYTNITCSTNNSSNVPVASCSPSSPSAGNGYTTVTCSTNNSAASAVQTCSPTGANSGNSFTAVVCTPNNTGPTGVDSCSSKSANNGNDWTTTSCNNFTSGPTGVASCTNQTRGSGNAWTEIQCGSVVTSNVPVGSCSASGANSGNSFTSTTCNNATTGPTPTASCTPVAASAGNSWTTTSCPSTVNGPTVVGSCTPSGPTAGNGYQNTTCGTQVSSTPVLTCTPGPGVTCAVNTATVAVQTCTASGPTAGNGYTTTTCGTNNTNNVPVASCSVASASAGNNWTQTSCGANVGAITAVQTCTPVAPTAGNSFVQTVCTVANTGPTATLSCSPVAASSGNSWVTTNCGSVVNNNVGVASCTASGPNSGNAFTTTSCPPPAVTTDVPVASCTTALANSGNNFTATTCRTASTSTGAASCTPAPATLANQYTATTCPPAVVVGPTGVAACTPQTANASNAWTARSCANPITTNVPVSSCTDSAAGSGNGFTTTTCNTVTATDVPSASCTAGPASAGNNWTATACRTVTTGPTLNTSCSVDPANAGNNFTSTNCAFVAGKKASYITKKTITTTVRTNGVLGTPSVNGPTSTGSGDVTGSCFAPGSEPPLSSFATAPSTDSGPAGNGKPGPNPPTGCTAWPCTTSVIATGAANGSVNALADVAQYYYATDLRPSMPNTAEEGVPSVGSGPEADTAKWQHMTTFTVALGVSGTLNYLADYKSASTITGDFADLRSGARSWPLWPDPASNAGPGNFGAWENPRSIDDFWHTAVNGRGQYFSASDSDSLVAGLADALAEIDTQPSAGAAAGVSNSQPVGGDNFVFFSSYVTGDWTGDVTASEIVLNTGAVAATNAWSAADKLLTKLGSACDNRNIYVIRSGVSTSLVDFSANTYACDAAKAPAGAPRNGLNATELLNFDSSEVALFSQFPSMTSGTGGQQEKAAGANLVNFLRGQSGLEGFKGGDLNKLYRKRKSALGDVIGGQPVYVKQPRFTYLDAGYASFKSAQSGRTAMVYVAANDGMLHAFFADKTAADPLLGGQEAWAVIPSEVLPKLYKLADKNYGKNHQFYVDGSPVVGDVYDSVTSQWSTMLVGGLNAGGKGFYALDITDPINPVAKWEFKFSSTCFDPSNAATAGADCHLGLSFGKPIITKLATGRWVVLLTSGYNNVRGGGSTGDGGGYLYVLDAKSGSILYKIDTGAGSPTTPSNLGQLNIFIDDSTVNNTAVRAYGGDMLGNIWRFDVNDSELPAGREATLLGQAKDGLGATQPITTRPELAELDGKPMVFVGTGRLLGAQDVNDVQKQSIYGIVDKLGGGPVYANLRDALKPMVVTTAARSAGTTRTVNCDASQPALCASKDGWVMDLPDSGERNNIDMILLRTTLIAGTNVPNTSACGKGGDYWLNYIDFATGMSNGAFDGNAVSSTSAVSKFGNNSLITGLSVLDLSGSTGYSGSPYRVVARDSSDGASGAKGGGLVSPIYLKTPPPKGRRISWREIAK